MSESQPERRGHIKHRKQKRTFAQTLALATRLKILLLRSEQPMVLADLLDHMALEISSVPLMLKLLKQIGAQRVGHGEYTYTPTQTDIDLAEEVLKAGHR
jgi:hypothetical protein